MRTRLGRFLLPVGWVLAVTGVAFSTVYLLLGGDFGIHFEHPWALLLLLAAPLVLWNGAYRSAARGPRLTFSRTATLAAGPRGLGVWLWPLSPALRAVALGLVAIALARPQSISQQSKAEVEGIDIMLVLDLSNSMRAADIQPTRIAGAKAVVDEFIGRRRSDRIGAVVFGRDAYTLCPLTLDYTALRGMVASLELGQLDGRGTAIGNAVATGLNRLRRSDAKSKVVILLTDGDSNSGNISPMQAAEFSKALRVKIYSVLMGERGEVPVQAGTDLFGRPQYETAEYPVNPDLLRQMSRETGGEFWNVTDARGLRDSFHQILDRLDRSKIADAGVLFAEAFPSFLAPALVLVALEVLLRYTRLRRFP
jgi:Ca-activated chloride channel family protein